MHFYPSIACAEIGAAFPFSSGRSFIQSENFSAAEFCLFTSKRFTPVFFWVPNKFILNSVDSKTRLDYDVASKIEGIKLYDMKIIFSAATKVPSDLSLRKHT